MPTDAQMPKTTKYFYWDGGRGGCAAAACPLATQRAMRAASSGRRRKNMVHRNARGFPGSVYTQIHSGRFANAYASLWRVVITQSKLYLRNMLSQVAFTCPFAIIRLSLNTRPANTSRRPSMKSFPLGKRHIKNPPIWKLLRVRRFWGNRSASMNAHACSG